MNVFELIFHDDMFSLLCLIAIFGLVGGSMANDKVTLWGLRAAAVAYIAFVVYAIVMLAPMDVFELTYIAFRGLFAAGLGFGPACMVFAIIMFFWEELPNVERRIIANSANTAIQSSQIDREQQRRDGEQRERQRARDVAECGELRLQCELLYNRNAEQLQGVLSPERFRELLDAYLSGQSDPQLVGKRTRMIQEMLTERVTAAETTDAARFESLQELAEHFATLRREAQEISYEDGTIDSIVTALNKQEDEAIEEFFKQ